MSKKENHIKDSLFELTKSKKTITLLKNVAVKGQKYELAANLRDIERNLLPDEHLDSKEMKEADVMRRALELTNLKVSMHQAYVINEVAKVVSKKSDSVDIKELSKIEATADEIFN